MEMFLKKKNDILIFIGGSIFIQRESVLSYKKSCKIYEKNYIPYYVLGCNIGPYYSADYLTTVKENVLKNAKNVCFRDSYSYSLCNDLDNVNLYPDIVLGMKNNKNVDFEKKVVISVIDVKKKFGKKIGNLYEKKLIELIEFFTKKGYSITLMSFCKSEGDEKTINDIYKKSKYKLKKHFYRGNIEEAINEIASSSIVVGSRFHANVLGLLFNKTIIPFSYSSKTNNMLSDLNYKGKIIDIKNIDSFDINSITEDDLTYKLNIDSHKKEAHKHFEKLDLILNGDINE